MFAYMRRRSQQARIYQFTRRYNQELHNPGQRLYWPLFGWIWSWSTSYGRQPIDQFVLVSGSLLGPMIRFYPCPFVSDNCLFSLPVVRPLWREDGTATYSAITDWSGHWGPITTNYRLIWDCVPASSPLTTRRAYGGGILTRLHKGCWISFTDPLISHLVETRSRHRRLVTYTVTSWLVSYQILLLTHFQYSYPSGKVSQAYTAGYEVLTAVVMKPDNTVLYPTGQTFPEFHSNFLPKSFVLNVLHTNCA
jgi:hypothetical protein